MAGLLIVKGKFDAELERYGVERDFPFAVHDPHIRIERYPRGDVSGIAKVGRFLDNQNNSVDVNFLVTGRYRPTFTIRRNEIVRFRHLTATVENLSGFRIVRKKDGDPKTVSRASPESENRPFYIVASDGIAYERPVRQTFMVCAGGERHDLLLQIAEPGEYYVLSDKLDKIQFFGTGPRDYILATIKVTDEPVSTQTPIEEMRFTSGIPPAEEITEKDIVRRRHFVFDLDGDTCTLPFPQFRINDVTYDPQKVAFSLPQGQVEEWIVSNPNAATHPLHIHVNPFMVKEAYSAFEPDPKLVPEAEMADAKSRVAAMRRIDHKDMWRDSIIIPPNGYLRIWVRLYADYVGKTVFHCHFLAHEETGMLQNFLITPPKPKKP
jgi:FtsP/CotA-like multicopper oxidase with cupredoxin domain